MLVRPPILASIWLQVWTKRKQLDPTSETWKSIVLSPEQSPIGFRIPVEITSESLPVSQNHLLIASIGILEPTEASRGHPRPSAMKEQLLPLNSFWKCVVDYDSRKLENCWISKSYSLLVVAESIADSATLTLPGASVFSLHRSTCVCVVSGKLWGYRMVESFTNPATILCLECFNYEVVRNHVVALFTVVVSPSSMFLFDHLFPKGWTYTNMQSDNLLIILLNRVCCLCGNTKGSENYFPTFFGEGLDKI